MAFSLSDYGWEAPACPPSSGTAGYALDVNDLLFIATAGVGRGVYPNENQMLKNTSGQWISPAIDLVSGGTFPIASLDQATAPIYLSQSYLPNYVLFGKPTPVVMTGKAGGINLNFNVTNFTISMWVKIPSWPSPDYKLISFGNWSSNTDRLAIGLANQKINLHLFSAGWPVATPAYTTTLQYPLDSYFYLTIARDNGVMKFYINGVLDEQVNNATNLTVFTSLILGGYGSAAQEFGFKDLRISNTARDGTFVPGNILGY